MLRETFYKSNLPVTSTKAGTCDIFRYTIEPICQSRPLPVVSVEGTESRVDGMLLWQRSAQFRAFLVVAEEERRV